MKRKNKKKFYQVTYYIKYLPKPHVTGFDCSGEYRYASLKRLNEEIQQSKNFYKGREKHWKLTFGPIFHCVEI